MIPFDSRPSGRTVDDFRAILQEFGGLPMFLSNWNQSSFSWKKVYEVARKYGYEANDLFSVVVAADPDNNMRRILYVRKIRKAGNISYFK